MKITSFAGAWRCERAAGVVVSVVIFMNCRIADHSHVVVRFIGDLFFIRVRIPNKIGRPVISLECYAQKETGFRMPHSAKINRNNDFRRIYQKGLSKVHALLVTYVRKTRLKAGRVAVVSSKKIGGAVARNRARRVVRAALQMSGAVIPLGWDVVFVCRTKTAHVKSTQVLPVLKKQLGELLPASFARETAP